MKILFVLSCLLQSWCMVFMIGFFSLMPKFDMLDRLAVVVYDGIVSGIFMTALFGFADWIGMVGIKWIGVWNDEQRIKMPIFFKKAVLIQIGLGVIATLTGLMFKVLSWI